MPENKVKTFQDINRDYGGMPVDVALDNLWMEVGEPFILPDKTIGYDVRRLDIRNNLIAPEWNEIDKVPDLIVDLSRKTEYLHFVCKYILNLDLLPFQLAILQVLWEKPLPMLIATRGGGKTFIDAVYIVLRALLHQGCRIAVVSASFRQSVLVYNYILQIWDNAPVLRDIVGNKNAPKKEQHSCTWQCGLSRIKFLPLGDGSTIRGERANVVLCDEFSCLDYNTLVETPNGLIRLGESVNSPIKDFSVINKDGESERPVRYIKTPLTDVYEITTEYGYSFRCSNIHKVLTSEGWKFGKDLQCDEELIVTNHYKFPTEQYDVVDENLAWLMGVLSSRLSIFTKNSIYIQTTNKEVVDKINTDFADLKPQIFHIGKNTDRFNISLNNIKLGSLLIRFGMEFTSASNIKVPFSILKSPEPVVRSFIAGLFAVESVERPRHKVNHPSKILLSDIQILLLKLNIISTLRVDKNKENGYSLKYVHDKKPFNFKVISVEKLSNQEHLYDYELPNTHSFMGNGFIQHNSVSSEVFETVVRGFASTKSDGTFLSVVKSYKDNILRSLGNSAAVEFGEGLEEMHSKGVPTILHSNQIILSGTAWYQFNHFYKYFCDYKDIILGKKTAPGLDRKNFAIIRLPHSVIPPGMMDKTIIAQGQATMDPQIFGMEYECVFSKDSDGFYLASTLHNATCPIKTLDGQITFSPMLMMQDPNAKCVMGIDPASENDNFAINIVYYTPSIRCVVYQWTTNRKDFEEMKRDGKINDDINDFNTFCIKQIRSLIRRFNVCLVVMDAAGGGIQVREGLKDQTKILDPMDELILDMDDENVKGLKGRHILKLIHFSNNEWRVNAHYGLKKDFVDLKLVFPHYDPAELTIKSYIEDNIGRQFLDSIDDCYYEIEQCKYETTMIRHDRTLNGTERWDLPRVVGMDAETIKKTMKRDRFTSLLLSNWGCRLIEMNEVGAISYDYFGGSISNFKSTKMEGASYVGKGANKMRHGESYTVSEPNSKSIQYDGQRRVYY